MILKKFNKIFDIQDSEEEEKVRFVQRINQTIFKRIEDYPVYQFYERLFRQLCYWLGINADDMINSANRGRYIGYKKIIPNLRTLTGDDFLQTLKILTLLYSYLEKEKKLQQELSEWVIDSLENATVDLGIRWKDGFFYPSGAKILDKRLIEDSYDWLDKYPNVKEDFKKAVVKYNQKKFDDVISDCYLVVEGLARKILNNSKTLDNNREELLKKLNLSQEWKSLLNNFINYANEYKRHASKKHHEVNSDEVEAFLYLTGLLVRLCVK